MSYIKIHEWNLALTDSIQAIELDDSNIKA